MYVKIYTLQIKCLNLLYISYSYLTMTTYTLFCLQVKESTYCGLEKVGLAFNDMMSGRNIGTTILKVSERANEVSGTQL